MSLYLREPTPNKRHKILAIPSPAKGNFYAHYHQIHGQRCLMGDPGMILFGGD
jgi:hypothetical protein